jgi:hypothetical protein
VERQVFFDPRYIGRIEDRVLSEMTLALCAFALQQVSTTRVATQHFAGRRYLKALRHRFLCFASRYRFWHREPGTYTLESSSQLETAWKSHSWLEDSQRTRRKTLKEPGELGNFRDAKIALRILSNYSRFPRANSDLKNKLAPV